MTLQKTTPPTALLLLMIVAIGVLRVVFNFSEEISVIANFSPLGAMALFGGGSFNRSWKAMAFPVLTLLLSDVLLHITVFSRYSSGFLYEGWYWVYGSLVLMALVGRLLLRRPTIVRYLSATLAVVLIHWLVTDLGMWINNPRFSQDLAGYIQCLTLAIPYELRFLTGTLAYGAILYGIAALLARRPVVRAEG